MGVPSERRGVRGPLLKGNDVLILGLKFYSIQGTLERSNPHMGVRELCPGRRARQSKLSSWKGFCRAVVSILTFMGLLLVRSTYSQFELDSVPGLPGVYSGSAAWGDYDNDG